MVKLKHGKVDDGQVVSVSCVRPTDNHPWTIPSKCRTFEDNKSAFFSSSRYLSANANKSAKTIAFLSSSDIVANGTFPIDKITYDGERKKVAWYS